jgi:hypothetical protein
MSSPQEILEELSRYDDDFIPAESFSGLPSTQDLALGVYICTIVRQDLGETKNDKSPIFRLVLQADQRGGAMLVEHAYVLKSQDAYDRLGADLKALEFDTENWRPENDRPFSVEFAKLILSKKLIGMRFQANRRAYAKQGEDPKPEYSQYWTGWAFNIGGVLRGVVPAHSSPAAPAKGGAVAPAPAPRQGSPRPTPAPVPPTQMARQTVPIGPDEEEGDDNLDIPF